MPEPASRADIIVGFQYLFAAIAHRDRVKCAVASGEERIVIENVAQRDRNLLPAAATTLLLSGTAVLMLGGGAATAFTQATAAQLADRSTYINAVMVNQALAPSPHRKGGF